MCGSGLAWASAANESNAMAVAMRVARRSKRQTSLLDNAVRLKGTPDIAHLVWPVATRISKLTVRRLVIAFVPTAGWKLGQDIIFQNLLSSGFNRNGRRAGARYGFAPTPHSCWRAMVLDGYRDEWCSSCALN